MRHLPLLYVLPLLFLIAVTGYSGDIITLYDGMEIKGDILSFSAESNVQIKQSNGVVAIYKTAEVMKIDWDPATSIPIYNGVEKPKRFLFLLNVPALLYQLIFSGYYYYAPELELQFALIKHLTMFLHPVFSISPANYVQTYTYYYYDLELGVMVMPFGRYLDGLYVKAAYNLGSRSDDFNQYFNQGVFLSVGYQFVFGFGLCFQFGIGGGYRLNYPKSGYNSSAFFYRLDFAKFGWSF